jgi:hypothetical protein
VFELDVCELDGAMLKDARRRSILSELTESVTQAAIRPPANAAGRKPDSEVFYAPIRRIVAMSP